MLFFVLLLLSHPTFQIYDENFDDAVLYGIDWPGEYRSEETENMQFVDITSSHKERYRCFLPTRSRPSSNLVKTYDGPPAIELLSPLFVKETCVFTDDGYWLYELCHGRFARQFHDAEAYLLGRLSDVHRNSMLLDRNIKQHADDNIRTTVVENMNLPYFEILLENGSACEVQSEKSRTTRVLYVCDERVKKRSVIYSVKETVTCEYEFLVLTSLLCTHPEYRASLEERQISCVPIGGSNKKPYALAKLQHDSAVLRRQSGYQFLLAVDELARSQPTVAHKFLDSSPITSFLKGDVCLSGKTGFWTFDFCYGKYVEQYHVEEDGKRTSINLGIFDVAAHLEWLRKRPSKLPLPVEQRKEVSHFYSSGSICESTGRPRQTEVRLRCLVNSSNSISLYLREPRLCQYILIAESALLCDVVSKADENGLIEIDS